MRVEGRCPGCAERTLDYTAVDLDIPHFPDATQLIFECASCGFKHSDFLIGRTHDPKRYTLSVADEDAVNARVVRSSSGTIRIPELGVLIEPGPASDAYVSNVEGVLARIESIIVQLHHDAETEAIRAECDDRLAKVRSARDGAFACTFILEDPFGNSAVLHDKARAEDMRVQEAARLKTGAYVVDLDDGAPAGVEPVMPQGNGAGGHTNGADPDAPAP